MTDSNEGDTPQCPKCSHDGHTINGLGQIYCNECGEVLYQP